MQKKKNTAFFVIVHNIRSLYNVGSIFRTADALGVDKIFLTGYTGTPKNPRLKKTALGAEETVPWEQHRHIRRLMHKLKNEKIKIVALENNVPRTSPLGRFVPRFPLALLVGEEVGGTKKEILKLCNAVIEIPMRGTKESLNVATAFGIAAWHIQKFKT